MGKKNWVRKVIQTLNKLLPKENFWVESNVMALTCPSDVLKEIAIFVPPHVLDDRHGCAPTFRRFLERAADCTAFELYIISSPNEQGEMRIEGAYVKEERFEDCLSYWLEDAEIPDQTHYLPQRKVFWVWWD